MKRLVTILSAALALGLLAAAGAQAAPGCTPSESECPPFAGQLGELGSGAGQMLNPRGIATDPVTGHVFVAETSNRRISEWDEVGQFIKAWGWGVVDGSPEPQVCTAATGCIAGLAGGGVGQLDFAKGVAVDQNGDVWVREASLGSASFQRLQKFAASGEFILMVGGEVNKTKVALRESQEANSEPVTVTEGEENLCTEISGDECGEAISGPGVIDFRPHPNTAFPGLAVGPDGTIYAGDVDRIQEFDDGGNYLGTISLPGAGMTIALTIDPSGRIYVISDSILVEIKKGFGTALSKVVREIAPDGTELTRLQGEWLGREIPKDPVDVAADAEGNVYAVGKVVYDFPVPGKEETKPVEFGEAVAFDPAGSLISFEQERAGFDRADDATNLLSLGTNIRGPGSSEPGPVYVGHHLLFDPLGNPDQSYVRAYGPTFGEPAPEPPTVASQHAVSVSATDAIVEARISPNFAADTTFWVQYGTGKCSEGGCESQTPAAALPGGASKNPRASGPVTLSGLEPGTLYHYRFVAENGAGGPVFAGEKTFRTYAKATGGPVCPNDALRLGASAFLPDCRAYELVSPLDKEGGGIRVLPDVPGYPSEVKQSNLSGTRVTYSSYRAFADPQSAPYSSQLLADRDPALGWVSRSISPPREGASIPNLRSEYRAFSPDLERAWLVTDAKPSLAPGAVAGYRNLYSRDSASGDYRAQCSTPPPTMNAGEFFPELQGFSGDGTHVVFRAKDALTPGAASGEGEQVYECVDGTELRLVSILPGGAPAPKASVGVAGDGLGDIAYRRGTIDGAVSEDGSRIVWTAASTGPGALYVRIGGTQTVELSSEPARYRAASPGGTKVIYTVAEDLIAAEVGEGSASSNVIAGQVKGFMGASDDAETLYFVSLEDLDDDGPAATGGRNLYHYDGESFAYIATLGELDVRELFPFSGERPVLTPVAFNSLARSSRVTADGSHLVFAATASLTGYDNTDQASGEAAAEVFRYDAAAEELLCVSCNPSGARPKGANAGTEGFPYWVAATIPGWDDQHHASRVLSEDGSRVFFEAADALALGDTNGAIDVYQWEQAGTGSCTASSATHSPEAGGCIDLISSGRSPQDSELVDTSVDGDDVFFRTAASLWAPDPGLVDIYDARVGGGFPVPPPPAAACEGDACQPPAQTPSFPTPASSTFQGAGNVQPKAKPKRKRCRKAPARRGKRAGKGAKGKKGKGRCAKSKKSKKTRKSNRHRRAGR